jgi:hypothetical protein
MLVTPILKDVHDTSVNGHSGHIKRCALNPNLIIKRKTRKDKKDITTRKET